MLSRRSKKIVTRIRRRQRALWTRRLGMHDRWQRFAGWSLTVRESRDSARTLMPIWAEAERAS